MRFLGEMRSGLTAEEVMRKWERERDEEIHQRDQMNNNNVKEWRQVVFS